MTSKIYRAKKRKKVLDLRPVQFEYNIDDDGVKRIGFIAEEVYDILPEFADYEMLEDGTVQCDNVRYGEITAALLMVIKQQKAELEEIKERLAKLEK